MKILKFKKFDGLHIVCKKCNRNIEVSQDIYNGCNHPIEKQRYKALFRINGQRKTKDFKSKEYDEAIKELLAWKDELANPLKIKTPESKKVTKHELFSDCILIYSDWLENVDVPKHEQTIRTKKYISETVSYVVKFKTFLESKGYNMDKFTVYQIDRFIVGEYYEYLNDNVPNHFTFNGHLKPMKNFFRCLINEKHYVMINPFEKAKLKKENPDPRSVEDDDFIKLLSVVNGNESIQEYKSGARKNMYKPYIKDSFELAAFTALRLEEVAILKYSDVVVDKDGELKYLLGTDLKYKRAHNMDDTKEKKVVYVPITPELEDLLNRLNYKEYLGCDKYLIDGNCNLSRKSLAKQMSHSFTFFKRKAGLPSDISIKHLRKAFLTKLEDHKELVQQAKYHKTRSVTLNHYVDKRKIALSTQNSGFSYFDNKQKEEKE
jgi:integrase